MTIDDVIILIEARINKIKRSECPGCDSGESLLEGIVYEIQQIQEHEEALVQKLVEEYKE